MVMILSRVAMTNFALEIHNTIVLLVTCTYTKYLIIQDGQKLSYENPLAFFGEDLKGRQIFLHFF